MTASLIIFAATAIAMICGILFFPKIKAGRFSADSYWAITAAGAFFMLAFCDADIPAVGRALVADTAVNPVKILVLFLSMTFISVFLDELGFFRILAAAALKRAGTGQKRLFLYIYATVSVLTVFTSNDVIVLSFTPFICYFAKNAKIDPMPYLAAEFVAANTWSMTLIIGNPTNIYLAGACGLGFTQYLRYSIIPTVFAAGAAFAALWLVYRKKLSAPLKGRAEKVEAEDKFLLIAGIAHLAVCTAMLAVGPYIGVEMWLVALLSAVSLMAFAAFRGLFLRRKPATVPKSLKRVPWQLVPFVLSMFVMIEVLAQKGVTARAAQVMGADLAVLKYGAASFFASNIINNIPMSVLFAPIIQSGGAGLAAVLATVIGSNLGAFFTPVGALAGIMWSGILKRHGVKFGYGDFLKMGVTVALPALAAALGGLYLSLALF